MARRYTAFLVLAAVLPAVLVAGPAMAQLGGQLGLPTALPGGGVAGSLDRLRSGIGTVVEPVDALGQDLARMVRARTDRLAAFVRTHRDTVEVDDLGQPARAHELLLLDPDDAGLKVAGEAGFALLETGRIDGLDLPYARFASPSGESLAAALRHLRHVLPGRTITADQLHFESGSAGGGKGGAALLAPNGGRIGLVDGGVLPGPRIVAQAGFAAGAPRPDDHAQAIVSLLRGAGAGAVHVADVYGRDPAGGSAFAIARALGWMAREHVPVVSISLVGPSNPLLARAVAAVLAQGMTVVAAVGNDGAASPPSYPASYDGVVAVTGIDGRRRVLFEAGHALHLDYAAPGADMTGIGLDGRARALRGTSFAAPLVAARLAAYRASGADASQALVRANGEARPAGARVGRGILCETCRKGI